MAPSEVTCWTEIRGAAAGDRASRERFAARYAPVIRSYLGARWRAADDHPDVDDAVQDVFVECLRTDGPLGRADPERSGGFRAFLYGITRNVAMRHERRAGAHREQQATSELRIDELAANDAELSRMFDRAWAEMLVEQAMQRLVAAAEVRGGDALLRVELLRLRHHRGLAPAAIAAARGIDVAEVYRGLERVRKEFEAAVLQVLAFDHPGASASALRRRCVEVLESLA